MTTPNEAVRSETPEALAIYAKAQRLIKAATGETYGDGEMVTNMGVGYAEPGYDDNAVWVLGNWNNTNKWKEEPTKKQTVPSRLGDALGRLGVQVEWLDEWTECRDCYKIVRTVENSYHWKPSYVWVDDCELICSQCALAMGEDALATYVNDATRAVTWCGSEHLESFGYVIWNVDKFQNGWHEGMTDDPKAIYEQIRRDMPSSDVVFLLDESSQFYIEFSAYVKGVVEDDE